jgi:hypothetical protein
MKTQVFLAVSAIRTIHADILESGLFSGQIEPLRSLASGPSSCRICRPRIAIMPGIAAPIRKFKLNQLL